MRIASSAGIAVSVLALTIGVRPTEAQPQPQKQAAVSVPKSVLERYVGEYIFPSGNTIVVRLKGDTLIREMKGVAGQEPDTFVPISETRFRMMRGGGYSVFEVEFVVDEAGGVTQVLRGDVGPDGKRNEIRVTRKTPGAAAAPATPAASPTPAAATVRVPTSVLERYTGEYQLNPQVTAVIRVKGDTLVREIMGQQQTLTPISETRFKLGGAEVEFVTDQASGVTMVIHNADGDRRYPRKSKG